MISRKEAKEQLLKNHFNENGDLLEPNETSLFENTLAFRVIDEIYDSIGSCSECKHNSSKENMRYCYEISQFDMGYCSKFERIEDENS